MANTLTIKGITIGAGIPKICVSIVGANLERLKEEAAELRLLSPDLVEWRVDFYEQVEDIDRVREALATIRALLPDTPLVFTFRSAKEGGEKEVSSSYYVKLNQAIAQSGQADLIDVELFHAEQDVRLLVDTAHAHQVHVIMSNHDFHKTPAKDELVGRLRKMQELGADLPKIAVMPTSTADVITLLDATNTMKEQYADRPIITMSMAANGVISRLSGELFGSAVTFGAAKQASAPGQVAISELRTMLTMFHQQLVK
ncbi:type I 3-dehydroquinate dehydratase [Paenibacillus massiliensis]|uniref:type I 3-dehydroquinate dehydratase n=1 Tax=Paenibacillus massiliensis TaxID=225917 RepID=UPI000424FD8B|nr:type I 3-dehydroquinate dehydratase [Paenibacillus massiliensis]